MVMRTYGLSGSGMDVDQMVKDLMKARRASYDKVWQQKTQLEWKKKDYNTIYSLSEDFRNNTLFDFRKQNNLSPKQVTSSNDSVVSATANGDAANVSHAIIVNQLADGVKLSSSDKITTGSSNSTLVSQFGIDPAVTPSLNFSINGKNVSIDITDQTTIYDVVSGINNSGADVKANYDATLDRFYIYSNKTGQSAAVNFTGSDQAAIDFMHDKLKIGAITSSQLTFTGQNAKINIDGADIEQSSNSFQISGVSYNLKSVSALTGETNPDGTPKRVATNISVQADIDKTIANVKAFVDTYNTYLKAINTELNETKYRDFAPLTDEQKAEMKDSDIKAWEEKAKSGMLRRDSILSGLASGLRLNFSTPVQGLSGKYNSAASIGVGTASYVDSSGDLTTEVSNGGKIYVNDEKLRKALEADPDIVYKMFGTQSDEKASEGVANRLYDQMYDTMKNLQEVSGYPDSTDTTSSIAKQLKDFNTRLTDMNDRLQQMEDRYYKQFDAMETALSKLNQQSSWLSQQFSK